MAYLRHEEYADYVDIVHMSGIIDFSVSEWLTSLATKIRAALCGEPDLMTSRKSSSTSTGYYLSFYAIIGFF